MSFTGSHQSQSSSARWHIPVNNNSNYPFYSARQQPVAPTVPVNDTYKITLKTQQQSNGNPKAPSATLSADGAQLQGTSLAGQTVTSSVSKTPSPNLPGKPDDTEKNIDKFCQKSLNDLMMTIAKLDSNGIVVIPEAQKNQADGSQVDSSTDEPNVNPTTDISPGNLKIIFFFLLL